MGVRFVGAGACVWFLSTFKFGDAMNEKFRNLLENHGVDLAVGSIEYWQNEVEMALLEMCDEAAAEERKGCAEDYLKIMRDAVAKERQACFELVYNHEDTYHHFGLCKRAAELIKQRDLT
jgi:hypothetical protein